MAPKIILADYDPRWPVLFESEKQRLQALGDAIVDVQHIGSTAVPGLAAKPIVDIMLAARSLPEADAICVSTIVALGYEHVQAFENEQPPRRYFRRNNPEGERTHHIHLVEVSSSAWRNALFFRDYLRSHVETRTAYECLKRELAGREWRRGLDYAAAKTAFIDEVLSKAHLDSSYEAT